MILTHLLRVMGKKFSRGSSASNVIVLYCLWVVEMSYTSVAKRPQIPTINPQKLGQG